MTQAEIKEKIKEIYRSLSVYKNSLTKPEKELYKAISDYQKVLEEEKLKEIRAKLE